MIKRESRLSECNLSVTKKASWGNTHEAFPFDLFFLFYPYDVVIQVADCFLKAIV